MEQTSNLFEKILQQHTLSDDKQESSWGSILSSAPKKHIPTGTLILREYEQCNNFMWLLNGTVRVYKPSPSGREITLYRVKSGEFCVLSLQCLMSGEGFPAVAIAETDLLGQTLNKHEFDIAIDESKEFRRYLFNEMSQRLGDVVQLVSDVTFQRLEFRLSCMLGKLFKQSIGNKLQITHSKLAQELGTTREMISRILKELEHKQYIQLSRGQIYLLSEDLLSWVTNS